MINSTKQLNEIIRNFSKENANSSISQFRAIIQTCKNAGIKFSSDTNYEETILSFTEKNFPEFILQKANQEIESLTKQNKYQEAAEMRDKIISTRCAGVHTPALYRCGFVIRDLSHIKIYSGV